MGRYVAYTVTLFFILFSNLHAFNFKKSNQLTSPCNVIDAFEIEPKLLLIGTNEWQHSCPEDRYVKGVYAEIQTELFYKAKCCGNASVSTFSWELHDLHLFDSGKYGVNDKWNVECQNSSVITGFRFAAKSKYAPWYMSSVRCSILKDKIVDKTKCTLLDLTVKVNSTTVYNKRWQHECPKGFAVVGFYDDAQFASVKYAKCCKLIDTVVKSGWKSVFTKNNGGFLFNDDGGITFNINGDGNLATTGRSNGILRKTARAILLPAITRFPLCLNVTLVIKPNTKFATMKIYLRTSTSLIPIATLLPNEDWKPNIDITEHVWLNAKGASVAQLVIDVQIWKGDFIIKGLHMDDTNICKADQCSNKGQVAYGCEENEICSTRSGIQRCICKQNYIRNSVGKCVSTGGKGKGGVTWEPVQTNPTKPTKPTKIITKQVQITTTKKVVASKTKSPGADKEKLDASTPISPWIYSVVGGVCGIITVVLILGGCLCYRKTMVLKHGRLNSFEHEIAMMNRSDRTLLQQQFSGESVTSLGASTRTLFRPFMQDLGDVENLTPPSRNGSFVSQTAIPGVLIDPTTGEPIYTKINRSITGNERRETIDEEPVQASPRKSKLAFESSAINNNNQTDGKTETVFDPSFYRRVSCITLVQPDYGDSDSEDYNDYASKRFYVPGDDEEELLDGLHELTPESIHISTKILGQGAFGLVKYGKLVSVNGTNDVAIKIMKQRNGNEITGADRVKFYQEAVIMSQFDHENVISLYGVIVGRTPCMVIEYLSRGCLWKYLKKVRRIRDREGLTEINYELHCLFLKMARDIVAGMEYLAGLSFVHRDLAARNILLDAQLNCKISDFGLSRHFLKDDKYYTSHGGQIPVKWTAPEALQFRKYSTQSDVWSYAIVLWEIWSLGLRPYDNWVNDKVMKEVTEKAYRLPAPRNIPRLIYKLMIDCWHPDTKRRPTFTQLAFCLNHSNERIVGKQTETGQRTRSITWNMEDEIEETSFDDLQNIYCKTE